MKKIIQSYRAFAPKGYRIVALIVLPLAILALRIFLTGLTSDPDDYINLFSLLAQASPYKKRLQTGIFTTVSCTLSLICLTILLIIVRTAAAAVPVIRNYLSQGFLISGLIAAAMLICWPIMYKYYMASLAIIFSAAFLGGMGSVLIIGAEGSTIANHLPSSPLVCILLAYIAVLAASAVSYIITQALYKKPFSKHVFGIMMKEL